MFGRKKEKGIKFDALLPPPLKSVKVPEDALAGVRESCYPFIQGVAEIESALFFVDRGDGWVFLKPVFDEWPDEYSEDAFGALYMGAISALVTKNDWKRYAVASELGVQIDGVQTDVLAIGLMWDGEKHYSFRAIRRDEKVPLDQEELRGTEPLQDALGNASVFPLDAAALDVALRETERAVEERKQKGEKARKPKP